MTDSWATSGRDLQLRLDPGLGVRAGLEAALRDAVRGGQLAPGARLPSSRTLARDLGIARNTVADAFAQLTAEGWLVARQGSGTVVAERLAPPRVETPELPPISPAARYDLRPGSPDVSAFPRNAWLAAGRRALAAASSASLGYGDPRGSAELREALAGYLGRSRGVRTSAERIVVCSGFAQGLALVSQVLGARGATRIGLEAYGVQDHRAIAVANGLTPVTLGVDPDGVRVEDARAGLGAVLVTPAHQFPLGVVLAPARRNRLVQWAIQHGGLIVEDDYDGEFRYDRQPVGALQALAPEHVVYAGTTSKSLVPGLRLGWLAAPADLVADLAEAKRLADRQGSVLEQLTLAEFLASGAYDRQVRRMRVTYRRRRDRLLDAVRRLPGLGVSGISAGLHAILDLPPGRSEEEVVGAAAMRGLALQGLESFSAADAAPRPPALVVGYGTPPDHAFTTALARLAAVLEERAISSTRRGRP